MKKILYAVSAVVLAAGSAQAAVIALDLPGAGTNANGTVVTTSVADASGATFDIQYTLGSISASNNPFVYVDGGEMGVGSDGDIATHLNTLEGDDGEGISFTSLSLANFNAGASGLTVGDFANLTFTAVEVAWGHNANDGYDVSFTSFATDIDNLGKRSTNPETIDLTTLSNYGSPETALYMTPDNTASNNRWNITGLTVQYTVIPEPATLGMILASGLGVLFIRRRFMM
ncbi:PEP-CTERM sorting domain-containing protein [Pontiella sp.]|uniref:PEP-CTERM sorting domain-containing protein n=1 Tax=Pontiella sp. TaxID=2837462 RepID=UPI00356790D5